MDAEKKKTEIMQTCFGQWGFVNCFGIQAVKTKQKKSRDAQAVSRREKMLDKCRMVIAEYEKRIAAEKRR